MKQYSEAAVERAMKVQEVILRALGKRITWWQAAEILAVSTVGLAGSFVTVKRTTAEGVMRYRLPFMVEDITHHRWFNWGPPPPGTGTARTAVAYNRYGKGQCVYIGDPIFWAMQWRRFWIRKWIPELMRATREGADRGVAPGAVFPIRARNFFLRRKQEIHSGASVEHA
jgi:hypothetical protein